MRTDTDVFITVDLSFPDLVAAVAAALDYPAPETADELDLVLEAGDGRPGLLVGQLDAGSFMVAPELDDRDAAARAVFDRLCETTPWALTLEPDDGPVTTRPALRATT